MSEIRSTGHKVFISYSSKDKHVADAACHFLEDAGITCWIAPRDIQPGDDWAGSITNAIQRAEICVVIISEHSIASREVLKEITMATSCCPFILPFRIDDRELSEGLMYHLSCYHWLDALTPPMEEQLRKLTARVTGLYEQSPKDEDPASGAETVKLRLIERDGNQRRQKLQPKLASPRRPFVGRDEVLEQINKEFSEGGRVVFLCGMGGIGKSEIAKSYMERNRSEYDVCVFANYTSDLLNLFANETEIAVSNMAFGDGESIEAYFERKLSAIRGSSDARTLIIIDNFDVQDDPYLHRVLDLPCRFLITTRTEFEGRGHCVVQVGEIEDMGHLKEIFSAYYRKPRNAGEEACVEEIIRLVNSHTITVEMIACQMKASHMKPEKMLSILQSTGISSGMKDRFRHDDSALAKTAFDYIRALYDMSPLSPGETEILRHLSIVSQVGMDTESFAELLDLDSFEDINSLAERSWIRLDMDNDRISLHPVVGEVIRYELKPDLDNCMGFLEALKDRVSEAWHQTYEENRRWEDAIFPIMRTFPNPTPRTLDIMDNFVTLAWIQADFRLAEQYILKLYDMCEREFGLNSLETGHIALRVAAVYYNQYDYLRSDPWYEKALECLLNSVGENHDETILALRKVGRACGNKGEHERSEDCFVRAAKAYDALLETAPDEKTRLYLLDMRCGSEIEFAMAELKKGDYEGAYRRMIRAHEKRGEIREISEKREDMYDLLYLGLAHGYTGRSAEAERYIRKALNIAIEYCTEDSKEIPEFREHLADEFMRQGRNSEAAEQLKLALPVFYKMYSHNEALITRIEQKLEECRNRR